MVTCWEKADLLALVCDVYHDFVTFPFGILGQVWYMYLIVSIPDPCCLSYSDQGLFVNYPNKYAVRAQIIKWKIPFYYS